MTYTLRQTKQIIGHMGMTCRYDSEARELQVKFIGSKESGYFTNDRRDAIWTAAAMLNHLERIPESSRPQVARERVMSAVTALGLRA